MAPNAPGCTLICTGSKATSTTRAIGTARRAVRRPTATLPTNGPRSPLPYWARNSDEGGFKSAAARRWARGALVRFVCSRFTDLIAQPRQRVRMLALQKIDELLADLGAQVGDCAGIIGADQRAQLDCRLLAVGDLQVGHLAVP